ncbi:MAG: hypothetical protein KGJ37_03665, partial [Verrucomicrobiota bacterium]|nr:hypothetical protein [Verrucomicrobiota bacterium]
WQASKSAPVAEPKGACDHMLAPNSGPTASRVPFVSVNCTPELLKTDAHCQSQCGVASTSVAKTPSHDHMLIRNTGPTASRVRFVSVECTPELKKTAECQSYCRSNL